MEQRTKMEDTTTDVMEIGGEDYDQNGNLFFMPDNEDKPKITWIYATLNGNVDLLIFW